jgi:hypothetical protein
MIANHDGISLLTASGEVKVLRGQVVQELSADPKSYFTLIVNEINNHFYKNKISPGVMIDAGANVGLFSIIDP